MPKRIKLPILAISIILLGFLRDYLFININWIYLTLTVNRPNQALNEFHFLLDWTPSEIEILKWILTLVFSSAFFGLTLWIIRSAFENSLYNRITFIAFALLFLVAGIFYAGGWIAGKPNEVYGIVRTLMGYVQSFIPAMILYVAFRFVPDKTES